MLCWALPCLSFVTVKNNRTCSVKKPLPISQVYSGHGFRTAGPTIKVFFCEGHVYGEKADLSKDY